MERTKRGGRGVRREAGSRVMSPGVLAGLAGLLASSAALGQAVLVGGTCDCYAGGVDTATPRAELVAYIDSFNANPGPENFDGTTTNTWFVHSFANLPAGITSAQIRIKARPIGGSSNDTFELGWVNASATGWTDRASWFFGPGNAPGVPVLFPGGPSSLPWTSTNYPLSACGAERVIDLATVTTQGGVSALSRLQSLRSLDFYVQDDTAIDCIELIYTTVCPGNVGTKTIVYEAGRQDSYTTPFDTAAPRTALSNFVAASSRLLKPFDRTDQDFYWFAHTFGNLPTGIVSANLEIGVRPEQPATNDTINLNLLGSSFAWTGTLSALAPSWSSGVPTTVNLDLTSLPTGSGTVNITSSLNSLKGLDVLVQDDTSVDYARLTVEVCPCTAKERVLRAGRRDEFQQLPWLSAIDGPPSRRAQLDGIRTTWKGFDDCGINKGMGHSFLIPNGGVVAARLDSRLKACWEISSNDSINLDLKPAGAPTAFNWGSAISALSPAGSWTPGTVKNISLNFDALTPSDSALGSNMLGAFGDRWLDVYTQDDTMVDHYTLRLTQCPPYRRYFGLPMLFDGPISPVNLPGGGFSISVPALDPGLPRALITLDGLGSDISGLEFDDVTAQNIPNGSCIAVANTFVDPVTGVQWATEVELSMKTIGLRVAQFEINPDVVASGTQVEWFVDDQLAWVLPASAWVQSEDRDIVAIVIGKDRDPDKNKGSVGVKRPQSFTSSTGTSVTGKRLTAKWVPVKELSRVRTGATLMLETGPGNPAVEYRVLGAVTDVEGLAARNLGGALLDTSFGGLTVSPQVGPGGVRFSGKRLTGLELELDTGDAVLAENDFVQQSFRGSLGSSEDVNLGYSRVRKVGSAMRVESDYSPAGITQHRVVVLQNGREVYNQVVPGTTGIDVTTLRMPTGCGKNQVVPDFGPPYACGIWRWPDIGQLPISIGSTAVLGNEVRVLSHNAPGPFNYLTSFDVESSLPEFAITGINQRVVGEQAPCLTLVSEDFDGYSEGDVCGQGLWNAWFQGNPPCGVVSSEQAFDGSASLKIVGNVAGQLGDDAVLEVQVTGGKYELEAMTYVPVGATGTGYLVLLNSYPVNINFSPNVFFDATTGIVGDLLNQSVAVPMVKGQWVPVKIDIDLDNDSYNVSYNNFQFLTGQSWTNSGGGGGQPTIAAIDLYAGEPGTGAAAGISSMYFDALALREVCETGGGCDSIDVNNDTSFFDPQDIEAFLSVYSEGPCIPETATCNDIDFNNDGSVFDPCDISSFLTVYAEGPCTPCGL